MHENTKRFRAALRTAKKALERELDQYAPGSGEAHQLRMEIDIIKTTLTLPA